ncbi:MAG TPA: CHAD domain-containing protein [Anaerolineae bacterium]|nr:CHAD domain-containing protein [Anaerolineae bacterium]
MSEDTVTTHEESTQDVLAAAQVEPVEAPVSAAPAATSRQKPQRKRLRLRAADPLPEAGRAIMAFHFARLRKLEKAAVQGDEEAIHDMRVAIRRVRAAFRIAGPYYKRKAVRSFRAELRALADELGAARDLDVIIGHARAFAGRRPPDASPIDAWLNHLQSRRAEAQQNLLDHLGGKRFAKFVDAFEAFVAEPGAAVRAGDHPAGLPRVRDAIPAAIWAQYSVVRAYEAVADPPLETLHALRIDFKRLRYLLEFFQGTLGTRTAQLIELTIRVQDHLGLLQDACVASNLLRAFIAENASLTAADLAGIAEYLNALQVEIQSRREQFPALYAEITGKPFRRQLARLLSNM